LTGNEKAATPVIIRGYRPDDLKSCRALWMELTNWHREIYQSPSIGGSDPGRYFDVHLERTGPELIWIAEVDGHVVGMAGLVPGENEAEVEPLVVSEAHRCEGIGTRLIEAVVQAARSRGIRSLKVQPVARNDSAIRFFHSKGFDVLGQIELLLDFTPLERQRWIGRERLAARDFRV